MIVQALDAEFSRLNLRKQCQLLTDANSGLRKDKEGLTAERDLLRTGLKQIASRLGVSASPEACLVQIGELTQKLETTADKLSVVVGDRDAMQEKRDAYKASRDGYKASRDRFKAKYESAASDLSVVKAKLSAYESQGFWDRLFRRVPVVLPCAEPEGKV